MPKPTPKERTSAAGATEKRFIVRSAAEAVERVRDELGPNARVTSVRQVKGSGLQRFLAAPRLEIIACTEPPPEPEPAAEPVVEAIPGDLEQPVEEVPTDETGLEFLNCRRFLERAGLTQELLARLDSTEDWRKIGEMDIRNGLPLVVRNLRSQLKHVQKQPLPQSVAFLGGAGSGKTTALCKLLAREVFIHGKQPDVLRLEVDKPHLDDGLLMYCDVLGIRCIRSVKDLDRSGSEALYVDIPGFSLREASELGRIRDSLDELGIEGRVLVMNGAYEQSVLRRYFECGHELKTGYQILTHIDELTEVGKLWQYLLDPERSLLFFSDGQNIAGDIVDDPFGYLLERTFPV